MLDKGPDRPQDMAGSAASAAGRRFTLDDIEAIYAELKPIARKWLRGERVGHTLQTTAVVNETLKRLMGAKRREWDDPKHFFRQFARNVRWVLVDHARRKKAKRRPGGRRRVELNEAIAMTREDPETLLAVHEAIDAMRARGGVWERRAQALEWRVFVGLDRKEVAGAPDVSEDTVKDDLAHARREIARALGGGDEKD